MLPITCPVGEGDDVEVDDGFEDEPPVCYTQWEGSYSITRSGPVDPDPEEPPAIPLPASALLLPLGLAALGAFRRRKTG